MQVFLTRSLLLILASLCWSCQKETSYTDLQGDWITKDNDKICFSFSNDRCSFIYPTGRFAQYEISDQVIIVRDSAVRHQKTTIKEYRFHILEHEYNTLTLVTDPSTLAANLKYSDATEFDTFNLVKTTPKHPRQYDSIAFTSSQCYGSCPDMKVTIDGFGKILFEGRAYTDKLGYFSGQIDQGTLSRIHRKLDCITLDSLKTTYTASWTDDQTCFLTVNTPQGTYNTKVYGFDKEPIELRIVFNELLELYKSIDLTLDSINAHRYPSFW